MGNILCHKGDDFNSSYLSNIMENDGNNSQNNNESNDQNNNGNHNNHISNYSKSDAINEFKDKINNEYVWVWIDPLIENEENQFHYNILFKNNGIGCLKFDNVDEGYNHLIDKYNKFKEIIIIISLKLFNNFYLKIKENINDIKFSPTIIIFTSDKERCKNQLKMNNIYNFNNDLFDTQNIFTKQAQIENFMIVKYQKITILLST